MITLKEAFTHLLRLIYPCYCVVCGKRIHSNKGFICLDCLQEIPYTNTWNIKDNDLEKVFWGKVNIKHVTALYYYNGDSPYRFLIYKSKYNNRPEIGFYLGEILGSKLIKSEFYKDVDFIIPVPLHTKRRKERGYNQSDYIAEGISKTLKSPININILSRNEYTETQTKKTKEERWANVKEAFSVSSEIDLNGKHILLVDDVLTTGATLEACAKIILETYNCNISIATICYAAS